MRTLLLLLAIAVPVLGLYDLAQANGSIHHNNVGIGDADATAVNEGNNAQVEMMLNQDIDLTEKSLVTVAPAMSANGVDCNMESSSYSLLIWSKGKSRCEKGSIIWRDYARVMQIAGPVAAMAVVCRYKVFRRVAHLAVLADGSVGVDCKKLRNRRATVTPVGVDR